MTGNPPSFTPARARSRATWGGIGPRRASSCAVKAPAPLPPPSIAPKGAPRQHRPPQRQSVFPPVSQSAPPPPPIEPTLVAAPILNSDSPGTQEKPLHRATCNCSIRAAFQSRPLRARTCRDEGVPAADGPPGQGA